MKMTSTCVAAALFAWMSSGAAWACEDGRCRSTAPPPQAEERIADCTAQDCHTVTPPEAVIACDGYCDNTETLPQTDGRIACGSEGDCNTDTQPEAVIACDGQCDNTDTLPQTDAKPA